MLMPAFSRLPGPLALGPRPVTAQPHIHQYRSRRRYGRIAVTGSPSRPRRYRHRTARSRACGASVQPAGYPFEPILH